MEFGFKCTTGMLLDCWLTEYTVSQKKTVQISFCQNFVKFPPILIFFWQKDGKEAKIV